MKKIAAAVLLAVFVLVTFGCGKNGMKPYDYTYKAENEKWSAEFKQVAVGWYSGSRFLSNNHTTLTVTYKKNLSDLASVKKITISYTGKSGSGSTTQTFDQPCATTTFTLLGGSKNGTLETPDSVIHVTIDVDGTKQELDLSSAG